MAGPNTNPLKKHFTYTINDFYKSYKDSKKIGGRLPEGLIPYKTYRGIMEDFFEGVFKKIIYENFSFMMPYSLGTITVRAFKTNLKKLRIDWYNTIKYKKRVNYLNRHTFGYAFGIVWDKSYVSFRNNTYYLFRATSSRKCTKLGIGKKGLSKHIFELSKDPEKRSYIKI